MRLRLWAWGRGQAEPSANSQPLHSGSSGVSGLAGVWKSSASLLLFFERFTVFYSVVDHADVLNVSGSVVFVVELVGVLLVCVFYLTCQRIRGYAGFVTSAYRTAIPVSRWNQPAINEKSVENVRKIRFKNIFEKSFWKIFGKYSENLLKIFWKYSENLLKIF